MSVTPYLKPYEKISDIDRYFDYNPTTHEMTFIGESLVCYIPKRYEVFNLLTLSDTVTSLAVMDLVIDDRFQAGLLMLTTIELEPDDVATIMVGDLQYVKLTLSTGCRFICNTERIADAGIVYAFWMEAIARGHLPYFIDYDRLATLFDQSGPLCDQNINADHCIFELIYAHLSRDPDNLAVQYRHTAMDKPFSFIALHDVGYATVSTTSKLLGSYFAQSLNASLIQTTTNHSQIEDLLRS